MARRATLAILLLTAAAWAHGGSFRGPGGGVPPGGLPTQPQKPARTGNVTHIWQTWWSYNQFNVLDFRRRQKERRAPVTGKGQEDPDAWRLALRKRLVPVMTEALKDSDKEVRTAAAIALGKFREKGTIPALQKLAREDNLKEVREAAVQGLALMGASELHDYFASIVADQGEQLRLRGFALMGLGRINDKKSRQYLLDFFDRTQKRARTLIPKSTGDRRQFLISVLIALQMSGDKALGKTFMEFCKDKRLDEDVRAYALNCVGKVKAVDQHAEALDILKRERSDQIRRSAAVIIGVLGARKDQKSAEALARALSKDKDKIVRHYAAISLGQIGGEFAYKKLKRHWPYANKEARGFFLLGFGLTRHPDAASVLLKEMDGAADANQAGAAALALGLLGARAHAPAVRKRLESSKAWVLQQTTALALGMVGDEGSAETVKNLLIKERQSPIRMSAAVAYALLRQHSAVKLFADLMRDSNTVVVRNTMAQILGYLASASAAELLLEVYEDTKLQRQTRAYALVALGTLADTSDFPIFPSLAFDTNYFVRCDPLDVVVTIL